MVKKTFKLATPFPSHLQPSEFLTYALLFLSEFKTFKLDIEFMDKNKKSNMEIYI